MSLLHLTDEQRSMLDLLASSQGEGPVLARAIAESCGLAAMGMGQRLLALERRRLIRRHTVRPRPSFRSDALYGWEITNKGLLAL